jgi:hypothetical protein
MRKELAMIIGEENILRMEKRSQIVVRQCGMPTGNMNAYEITEEGWHILTTGIVGPQGFNLCPGTPEGKTIFSTEKNGIDI